MSMSLAPSANASFGIPTPASTGAATQPATSQISGQQQTQLMMAVVMALIAMIKAQAGQQGGQSGQPQTGAQTQAGGQPQSFNPQGFGAPQGQSQGQPSTGTGHPQTAPAAGTAPSGGTAPSTPAVARNEKDVSVKPSATETRPPGDNRSAEQIVKDNPVLANLGNQKDINQANLKKQCGDWENDPNPQARADAAYRAAHVLNYIDNSKQANGQSRANVGDGNIEGITSNGDARHGTEAGMVKDFGEQGYGSLAEPDQNNLPTTTDTHVNADGSNQNEASWAIHHPGEAIGHFVGMVGRGIKTAADDTIGKIPVIGNALKTPFDMTGDVMQGTGNAISTSATGGSASDVASAFGDGLKNAAHDYLHNESQFIGQAASVANEVLGKIPGLGEFARLGNLAATTISGGMNVADTALMGGDVKKAGEQMGANVAGAGVQTAVGLVDPTGIAAGVAGQMTTDGINSQINGTQFNAGQSFADALNPLSGLSSAS